MFELNRFRQDFSDRIYKISYYPDYPVHSVKKNGDSYTFKLSSTIPFGGSSDEATSLNRSELQGNQALLPF
jgi:hypothetical protein